MAAAMAAPASPGNMPRALLIAGPTCSGKSALAFALARALGGTVINADSMQVYRQLRILTARPTQAEEQAVPHALYGVREASLPGDVGWWRQAAFKAMGAAREAGRLPILCGGSGLYFLSLTRGLADIPVPDTACRTEARDLLAKLGPEGLHARLAKADPDTAARIRPSDGQRIARAWEVFAATGKGLADWQVLPAVPAPWSFRAILIDPPRAALRAAIGTRCAAMVEAGAIDEVRALVALGLDPALPAMRAHGVPEFSAHLDGRMRLETAVARTALVTGQYTKRQATWFRHHDLTDAAHTQRISTRISHAEQFSASQMADMQNFILSFD